MFKIRRQSFSEPFYKDFLKLLAIRTFWVAVWIPVGTWALVMSIRNQANPAPHWAVILIIFLLALTPSSQIKPVLKAKLSVVFDKPLNRRKSAKLGNLLWYTKGLDNLALRSGAEPLSRFASPPHFQGSWKWNWRPIEWFNPSRVLETCQVLRDRVELQPEIKTELQYLETWLSGAVSEGMKIRLALELQTAGERLHAFLGNLAKWKRNIFFRFF